MALMFLNNKSSIQTKKIMPHIAVTMLPGRSHAAKQDLAERLRDTRIDVLGVEPKYISVSIEDVEMKDWKKLMERIKDESMIINPQND